MWLISSASEELTSRNWSSSGRVTAGSRTHHMSALLRRGALTPALETVQRFLRADRGDLVKATKRLKETLQWRQATRPEHRVCSACFNTDLRQSRTTRGLHSSTFQLNVSTFCKIVGCMIFTQSIRQGDNGRCDRNGLG